MNDKTKLLFKAYLALSATEKAELEKAIKDYNSRGLLEQRNYSETFNKSLGPIDGAKCALCGK